MLIRLIFCHNWEIVLSSNQSFPMKFVSTVDSKKRDQIHSTCFNTVRVLIPCGQTYSNFETADFCTHLALFESESMLTGSHHKGVYLLSHHIHSSNWVDWTLVFSA